MKQQEIIKKFREETGYTLEYNDGKFSYGGYLDLECTQIASLPDGLTVGGYLDLEGTQIASLPDGLTVGGSLYLRGTQIASLPDGLTVGGSLDLEGTQIASLPDGLTVGGSLYLRGTQIASLPDNLTVGGDLYLEGTQIASLPDGLTVGGYLDLEGTQIASLPDGLTVGGYLDLEGTQIASLPDNLTVGGDLYLRGTQIASLPDGLNRIFDVDMVKKLWDGKRYIKADGIFTEVVKKRSNAWEVKKINGTKTFYLVTDGNGKYAHGDTISEAKKDLIYKIKNKDKSVYGSLNLDSVLSFEEAIECYRVITGACSFGTKDFVENYLTEKKDKYTIREMIELTKGRYGNETFKEFFNKD